MSSAATGVILGGALLVAAVCALVLEGRAARALVVAGAAVSFPGALQTTTASGPELLVAVMGWAWAGFVVASVLSGDPAPDRVAAHGAALLGGLTAVAGAVATVAYDPFSDADCLSGCVPNPVHLGLMTTDPTIGIILTHGLGLGTACWAAAALLRRPRPHGGWPGSLTVNLMPCIALALEQASGVRGAVGHGAAPSGSLHVLTAAMLLVALGVQMAEVVWLSARIRHARTLLADPGQRDAQAQIVRALGDPTAMLRFTVGGPAAEHTGNGETLPAGRRLTRVTSDRGEPLAVIEHASSVPPRLLARLIGPTARAALQNEYLELELRRQAHALQASARRLVNRADAERRALERDLHDGAQQRILGLAVDLRKAADLAAGQGRPEITESLVACVDAARRMLEAVRHVAQGVHPAVLEGSGIPAALRHLADSAAEPFPLVLGNLGELTPEVKAVAYAIARDASEHPLSALEVRRDASRLVLLIDTPALPAIIEDRVRVADGSVRQGRNAWEVTLPCG